MDWDLKAECDQHTTQWRRHLWG